MTSNYNNSEETHDFIELLREIIVQFNQNSTTHISKTHLNHELI